MDKTRYKRPTKRSKAFVPPALWDHAISFCRCYPLWIAELAVCDTSKTIMDYSQPRIQSSISDNPTERLAIRRAKLAEKIQTVEEAAKSVSESETMQKFMIMGVTHHLSYETLKKQGIPCGRRMYHELRREMIYLISQKL